MGGHEMDKDVARHNRAAWDRYVDDGIRSSIPVSSEVIAAAERRLHAVREKVDTPVVEVELFERWVGPPN